MVQLLGWCSSVVLFLTIASQIRKQWRERTAKGISPWLYVGQTAASGGFAVYSGLLHNWVFLITNIALTVAAVIGLGLTLVFKRSRPTADRRKMPTARHVASVGFQHSSAASEDTDPGRTATAEGTAG